MEELTKGVVDKILTALIAISLSLGSWAILRTVDHETRLTVMENIRFTRTDASDMESRMRQERQRMIDEIKSCLNRIQRKQVCD